MKTKLSVLTRSVLTRSVLTLPLLLLCVGFGSAPALADTILIDLTLPKLEANPYHRPYVAVWLETPDRKAVATLAAWYEQDTWLKDLRQWWRKVGRSAGNEIHGVTGATRKPGLYRIQWSSADIPKGNYLINFEAVREEGGRSYKREPILLGTSSTKTVLADGEFGDIVIKVIGNENK